MGKEMHFPLLSVIVPVYNAQDYIEQCVDSVLEQTIGDFELLLVDDGSTDDSGRICDEYAEKDSRILVFHIENGGSSRARNIGLDHARGEYIGFVDSDDYIQADMYEVLLNHMVREEADMSCCGIFDVYPGREPIVKKTDIYVMSDREAVCAVMRGEIATVSPVNKLYKKVLFETTRYPEGKDTGEDASVIVELLAKCKKVVLTTEQKYYYVHRQNSITTGTFRLSDTSIIEAYQKNYEIIKDKYPDLLNVAEMRICWAHFFVLDKLLLCEDRAQYRETEDQLVHFLRRHIVTILTDNTFQKTRKAAMCILMFSRAGYRQCVRRKIRNLLMENGDVT